MTKRQGAALDRKRLFADPIMVTTVVVLIAFLTLFIIYPLAILLVDSFISPDGGGFTLSVFKRIFDMWTFRTAIGNTLKVGFMVGIGSALIGLLFAYVEVYVKVRGKFMGGLFKVVSMLPVVSPPLFCPCPSLCCSVSRASSPVTCCIFTITASMASGASSSYRP